MLPFQKAVQLAHEPDERRRKPLLAIVEDADVFLLVPLCQDELDEDVLRCLRMLVEAVILLHGGEVGLFQERFQAVELFVRQSSCFDFRLSFVFHLIHIKVGDLRSESLLAVEGERNLVLLNDLHRVREGEIAQRLFLFAPARQEGDAAATHYKFCFHRETGIKKYAAALLRTFLGRLFIVPGARLYQVRFSVLVVTHGLYLIVGNREHRAGGV